MLKLGFELRETDFRLFALNHTVPVPVSAALRQSGCEPGPLQSFFLAWKFHRLPNMAIDGAQPWAQQPPC